MSCPYLEKGRKAYCHAFGGEGLAVENSDIEAICFSGEFSQCPFLSFPVSGEYGKSKKQRNVEPGPFHCFLPQPKPAKIRGSIRG